MPVIPARVRRQLQNPPTDMIVANHARMGSAVVVDFALVGTNPPRCSVSFLAYSRSLTTEVLVRPIQKRPIWECVSYQDSKEGSGKRSLTSCQTWCSAILVCKAGNKLSNMSSVRLRSLTISLSLVCH
jgi:hypothetical protein